MSRTSKHLRRRERRIRRRRLHQQFASDEAMLNKYRAARYSPNSLFPYPHHD